MGRKALPAEFARTEKVSIMLTPVEYETLDAARERLGYATTSDFVRDAITEAVKRPGRKTVKR